MICMLRTWNTTTIMKHFGEGRLEDAGAIQKDLQLHDVNIACIILTNMLSG